MQAALEGKIVAVTGGFGVLGRAVAAALEQAGASVALIDRAPAPPELAGRWPLWGETDLSDRDSARDCLAAISAQCGGLDGLVNVAGGFVWQTVEDGELAAWDQMYAMNVRTTLLASQAALPYLLHRGGRVVNVGALAAAQAQAGMGAYTAAKAGVARLTEAMAEEFKDRGVSFNAVLPSIIDTPANRGAMPDADPARWVAPAALAQVIVFLLSDQAAAINGALIPVKGRL